MFLAYENFLFYSSVSEVETKPGLDVLAATEVVGGSFVALQETQTYRNVCNGVL
jgi:hypothetical protein